LTTKTWYFIEMTASYTTGTIAVSARVNGESVLSTYVSTGLYYGGDALWNTVRYKGAGGGNLTWIDDPYCGDAGFIGDRTSHALRPAADGASLQWTPLSGGSHYTEIDEVDPDYDGSYIYSNTAGDQDLCTLGSIPAPAVVDAIQSAYVVEHNEGGTPTFLPTYIFNGGSYDSPTLMYPAAGWLSFLDSWRTNPATGLAFATSDVNIMQMGLRRIS